MDLLRDEEPGGPVITGFAGGGFRVRERIFPRGVLIEPRSVADWQAPVHVDLLTVDMLGDLLDLDPAPEFLLLGTGLRLAQPPRAFVRELEGRGVGVEAMDSRAAARTWAVLMQEQRQIVGAFLPLGA